MPSAVRRQQSRRCAAQCLRWSASPALLGSFWPRGEPPGCGDSGGRPGSPATPGARSDRADVGSRRPWSHHDGISQHHSHCAHEFGNWPRPRRTRLAGRGISARRSAVRPLELGAGSAGNNDPAGADLVGAGRACRSDGAGGQSAAAPIWWPDRCSFSRWSLYRSRCGGGASRRDCSSTTTGNPSTGLRLLGRPRQSGSCAWCALAALPSRVSGRGAFRCCRSTGTSCGRSTHRHR